MRLYDLPRSPWCQKVRVALAEKGLAYERHIVLPGQEYEDWFLALDPTGRLPVLTDRDHIVRGATVINEYLEEAYPDRHLLPMDPGGRARARMWVAFVDEILGTALEDLYLVRHAGEVGGEDLDADVADALSLLEDSLEPDTPFASGDTFTLADAALAPFVVGLVDELGLQAALADLPKASAYRRRLERRPSVAAIGQAWGEWREMAETLGA